MDYVSEEVFDKMERKENGLKSFGSVRSLVLGSEITLAVLRAKGGDTLLNA